MMICSINYEAGKGLARILRPLVGKSPHHMKNTDDFVQQFRGIRLQPGECVTSYDVSTLFTWVPIESAITIIRRKLELDPELHTRTPMKVEHIISLLGFCLKSTYFQFQGRFFEQLQGTVMGSPISPSVANLFMVNFEIQGHQFSCRPSQSMEEVCGGHLCGHRFCKEIKFPWSILTTWTHTCNLTTQDAKPDGPLPFLNIIVLPQPDNSLLTSMYRKPTHTDLYLQWDSHHHLQAKFSVINTLRHRARTVCSNNQLLKQEKDHLNRALINCKYPTWALIRANFTNKHNKRTNKNKHNKNSNIKNKPYIVVPYMKGLSESCRGQYHQEGPSSPKRQG